MSFTHLNLHSHYSLLRGTASPEALCRAVKAMGMKSIALTDTNGLYGMVLFLQVAKEYGLRPIIGAEVRRQTRITPKDGRVSVLRQGDAERAVLLVKTQQGYENLCQILTDRHLKEDFYLCQALQQYQEGLVILTASQALLDKLQGKVEDLYAEVVAGKAGFELLQFAKVRGIAPVAANRVHFIERKDFQLHRLLRAIDLNTTLTRLDNGELEDPSSHLKTPQEMISAFFFCPEAVENTDKIAKKCTYQPDFGLVFPQYDGLTDGETFELLRQCAYRGARRRYGAISDAVRTRLEFELKLIRAKRFSSIFLVVRDIVRQSPRTCGRGSAAASIVSYCLEIAHVDPIRHNLYFERFLNPGRQDPPDIDVDFAWDERDDILQYVFDTYGRHRSAMISNHVTFQKKAAIHEVAKVYGLPEPEIMAVTGRLSGYYYDMVEEVQRQPSLRYHDFSPPWPEILGLGERLVGIPRNLSVHCGGVVLTPDAISHHVPVQRAVKEVDIIHWEKDQAEDAGLIKIDLLGNRSLGVIRDALEMIEVNYGIKIDYAQWNPIDDPEVQAMIASGETMGVFYVESPATRLLQKKAGVGDFEHLVIHSSIIRPAANPYIHDYLRRLKGEPYEPLHPIIGDILSETFGIMVYQEDVSKVAVQMAGFDASEGDELRKILSKKHKEKRLKDLQRKFVAGALARGVAKESIRQIWEMILSFSGYSFCKPHSASFALVSFKSAWLRCHYPAEFIAAVISNQGGFYSTFAYISEAKRLEQTVLLPDVNNSPIRYWGKEGQVRMGLQQIKGLTKKGMETVVECREQGGLYLGFDDFMRRTELDSVDVRLLIKAGAFDELEGTSRRAELMWRVEIKPQQAAVTVGQAVSLFEQEVTEPPVVPPYDRKMLIQQELEVFGFLVTQHPLELYQERLQELDLIHSDRMQEYIGKRVQMAGWLITGKVVSTKHKELMEFLTFEDMHGLIEAVFFPKVYDKYCFMLNKNSPYILRGVVDEDFGAVTLRVEKLAYL